MTEAAMQNAETRPPATTDPAMTPTHASNLPFRPQPARSSRAHALLVAGGLVAIGLLLPGCYSRTVESRGLGTKYRAGNTYNPNLKSTKEGGGVLDGAGDLLIGPRTIEDRKR